ncbi:MAG: tetratricopeptide repeat protein [Candidatus Erginobacter occultus]|nr:tetratricopeptide repeat protein [Candidatus Erginobacter occultus]
MKRKSTIRAAFYLLVIAAAGLAVYLNSLGGEFHWDDRHFIVDNVYLRDWSYLPEIFTGDVAAGSGGRYNYYRPLTTFTYLIDYTLWELNPQGYHLAGILYHLLVAAALFYLVRLIFGDLLLSFLTALLYVVHPVHTETVAYVSGRPDSLCALFMLLSFIMYVKYLAHGRPLQFILMAVSFAGAILSRENSVVLPLLLLVYHLAFRVKLRPLPFLSIALSAAAYVIVRWQLAAPAAAAPPLPERIPGFFASIFEYLRLLVLPLHLHQEYGVGDYCFSDATVIAGAAIMAAALLLCFRLARMGATEEGRGGRGPAPGRIVLFSLLWFFAALLPYSGVYPIRAYMAEHWLYVPSIGLFLVAAYGLSLLYRSRCPKAISTAGIAALLLLYGSLTIAQNTYFSDPLTFYERTVRYSPWSARIRNNLAIQYYRAGRIDEAEEQFRKAIEIDPLYPEASNNLGHLYYARGRNEDARALYLRAIGINPRYAEAYCNLGVLCVTTGNPDEGLAHFQKAVELNPLDADAFFNLGLALRMKGREGEALSAFSRALRLDPAHGPARRQIAPTAPRR